MVRTKSEVRKLLYEIEMEHSPTSSSHLLKDLWQLYPLIWAQNTIIPFFGLTMCWWLVVAMPVWRWIWVYHYWNVQPRRWFVPGWDLLSTGGTSTSRTGNLWLVPLRNEKEDMAILMNHCTHVLVSFSHHYGHIDDNSGGDSRDKWLSKAWSKAS